MSSAVQVGAATDTGPTYTVTINRNTADTTTDWTTCTAVVLLLPDGSTQAVTKTTATAPQWTGTVRYNAWFTSAGVYPTRARATFPGQVITIPDRLSFAVATTS